MAAQENGKPPIDKGQALGVSGTVISTGVISLEEYNKNLVGRTGLQVWDEMRRSDGTTAAVLRIVKLPVMSATFEVRPATDDDQGKTVADTINHNLEYIGWNQILKEILLFLDYGFSVFEKVYDLIPYENGDYLGISALQSRRQRSIFKWEQEDGKPGVTQLDPNGGQLSIPMDKIIIFTNDREGNNYEGRSLLRPAYKHWYMKESLYKIDALAHEKQGLGIPKLTTPAEASTTDKDTAREVVRNIRANQASYAEMPEGFNIEFLDMKANTTRDPINSINHHTVQIMKSVLAQFIELGSSTSKGGSYSQSADHSALFMKSEEAIANYVVEQINRYFIPDIMAMNFPNVKDQPELSFSDLSDADTTAIADSVQKLMTVNAITPDADLEVHLRNLYELPDLPKDIADDYNNRVIAPKGATPQASPAGGTNASLRRVIDGLDKYIEASIHELPNSRSPKG